MFTLDGYSISTEIYQGSKTLVYRAIRMLDKQPVIIKFLNAEYPSSTALTKLRHEYAITKDLDLKGVIKAVGLESCCNSLALILEDFNGGQSLKNFIAQQSIDLHTFLNIAIQLADILAKIHQHHIIHKDIKPANIIVNFDTGQVKLTDFGISSSLFHDSQTLNPPHTLEGTLAYMSPEQTGRMNRMLDYRSDFYSLGVTFYEMLVGKLPFQSSDPMELVHCHIAQSPTPLHLINPTIPPLLSAIIMKLLAKTAEERYQSAYGLKADLQICLSQLHATGNVGHFVLGYRDISDKFQISQKLYGRETEINTLLTAFDRASNPSLSSTEKKGGAVMMLVSGYSGIGKTSMVQEIYKPITQKRGYFIEGEFDQIQHHVPYSAIIKAFESLIKQLLTESESQLQIWQNRLQNALGVNAQVITEVILEVELIIGKPLPVPTLPPAESENRFNLVFQNFIKVFTQPEHPLVLFLDNLQWADTASLKLIQWLITTVDNQYLFVIGAYRDNEVNASHPLQLMLSDIQKADIIVEHISLSPLKLANINQLLADTFHCASTKTEALAELVLEKTQGNPFFVNEFLKSLYAENLLIFVPPSGNKKAYGWQWDLAKIQVCEITDNVVELMADKIQKLSEDMQQILKLAACIGKHFLLETLLMASEKLSKKTTTILLQQAVAEGLLMPLNSVISYQISMTNSSASLITNNGSVILKYQFAHERIQQAAYSLIPEEPRQKIHKRIGELLLQNTTSEQLAEQIFAIVNQLNLGQKFIHSQTKQDELAKLNLMAGQKAKASAAYEQAFRYLLIGIELLEQNSWQHQYELTLALTVEAAELAYLSGDFEKTDSLIEWVLQNANSLLDKVKVYEIRMQAYKAQNKLQDAVTIGFSVLAMLGVTFPNLPNKIDFLLGSLTTKLALARQSTEALCNLPSMTKANKLAAMRIMLSISPPVYTIMPKLLPLILFKRVKLSLQYGNAYESAPTYASYGYILSGIEGDIEQGYQFGQLALRLLEQNQAKTLKARTFQIVYGVITHYKEHIRDSLPPLLEAYQSGLEIGDFEYAAMSANNHAVHAYFVGKELTKIEQELASYVEYFTRIKQETSLHLNKIYRQTILNLTTPKSTQEILCLIGKIYNEEQMLPLHQKAHARGLVFQVYYHKMTLCYIFRAYPQAFENASLAEQYLDAVIGSPIVPIFHFYDSLAKLANWPLVSKSEQKRILNKVTANQKKMKKWAHHAQMNYLHKFYLVEAERARVLHREGEAREFYDKAIALAQENKYVNEEALAYELAGQFYWTKGQTKIAYVYLRDAHHAYSRWGATAKLNELETRYSHILTPSDFSCPLVLPDKPQIAECQGCNYNKNHTISTLSATKPTTPITLDLNSVLKASQAIAGEIMLKHLLAKLMKIVIENAGAQRGFLLLNPNGQWVIDAKYTVSTAQAFNNSKMAERNQEESKVEVLCAVPLEENEDIAVGIIHYVARTKEYLVLNDATRLGSFTNEPHILKHQPKSILCVPLINQGNTTGILYLENNLVTGAFTPARLEMLHLLTSQIAISIDNARLYAGLEEKVRERTRDIEAQNIKLVELNEESEAQNIKLVELNEELVQLNQMKNEFLGIAAHDLKNPLWAIQELSQMIEKDYQEISQEEVVEYAQMISVSSQQMFELISNLLDVNRIESGKMRLSPKTIDLWPLLQRLVKDYRERAKAKDIQLQFAVPETPFDAYVDEHSIRQVLDNLLSNAVKYSPTGKSVSVHLSQYEQTIRCTIQDEGPGLSKTDQEQLFGKFMRLTPEPTGGEHSTGLGLFIVKKFVEAMNGKVWCESELGKGSTFVIELPISQ